MPRPRGRPRMDQSKRRSEQMAIRFTKSLRKQLEGASRANGATLTAEIERRVWQSFALEQEKDRRFGSAISVYLPAAVNEVLCQVAFKERCKIHDIVLEGIELALRKRNAHAVFHIFSAARHLSR